MRRQHQSLTIVFLAVVVIGFLMPLRQAHAVIGVDTVVAGFLPGLYTIREITSILIGFIGTVVGYLIAVPVYIPPSVSEMWKVLRDFCNLFFILVLIIMAFGTIFNIEKYSFKKMFVPFLIAALMINFSLTISSYILTVSKDLSGVMLTSINGTNGGDFWKIIDGKGFSSPKVGFFKSIEAGAKCTVAAYSFGVFYAGGCTTIAAYLLVSIALSLALLFSYIVLVIFMLIRLPVLWVLFILSPIAWLGLVLPGLKKFWTFWWDEFLGWVFWVPAYLGILLLLVIILNARDVSTTQFWNGTIFAFFGPDDFIYFFLSLIFILGGLWVSLKVGKIFKGSANMAAGWAQTAVKRIPIPYGRDAVTGEMKTTNVRALSTAPSAAWNRFKEEGLPGRFNWLFGGERAQRVNEGRVAESVEGGLGYTPEHHAQEARAKAIDAAVHRFEELHMNQKKFKETLDEYTKKDKGGIEWLALRQLQATNGWYEKTDAADLEDILKRMGGGKSVAGKKFLKALDSSNYRDLFADAKKMFAFANGANLDSSMKKSMYKNMTKTGALASLGQNDAMKGVQELLLLTEHDEYESREKARTDAEKVIRRIFRNDVERNAQLTQIRTGNFIPTGAPAGATPEQQAAWEETQKLLANTMIENEDINNYDAYWKAINYFGIDSARSAEAREKVNKYSPVLGAEIEWRERNGMQNSTVSLTDPTITGHVNYAGLGDGFYEALKGAKNYDQVADASQAEWETASFEQALRKHVKELEEKSPTVPDHWVNPPVGSPPGTQAYLKGQDPGAGRRYLLELKNKINNPKKIEVIQKIVKHWVTTGEYITIIGNTLKWSR